LLCISLVSLTIYGAWRGAVVQNALLAAFHFVASFLLRSASRPGELHHHAATVHRTVAMAFW
jgi:hypothetical protein